MTTLFKYPFHLNHVQIRLIDNDADQFTELANGENYDNGNNGDTDASN